MSRGYGFHEGELAVQREARVAGAAVRLEGMLGPAELTAGAAKFLAGQSFVAVTARDHDGRLWTSPLIGPPGFLEAVDPTTLRVHARPAPGDPLRDLTPDQPIGLITVDYARRRRFRLNGTLTQSDPDGVTISVEEGFGNCPQYIPQRSMDLSPREATATTSRGTGPEPSTTDATLTDSDGATIGAADTFFLGTAHPDRGNDASHRGGPPGFVRTDGQTIWWPDYAGNNLFTSLGNLHTNPEAALLFPDFSGGTALHLTGTAALVAVAPGTPGDDGRTGRRVVFTVAGVSRPTA